MIIQTYTVDDFNIGDSVVPVGLGSLTLVVVDIDRKAAKVICRLSEDSGKVEHVFSPGELEKEPFVHPPTKTKEAVVGRNNVFKQLSKHRK